MNTQTINLTPPIDGVQYGISNAKIKVDNWCYDIKLKCLVQWKHPHSATTHHFKKVICSTNPKDTRFPYLQISKEQEVEKLANDYCDSIRSNSMNVIRAFIKGFNANKGIYTQEQMEKAFEAGRSGDNKSLNFTFKYQYFKDYIQSLQPTAKQVKVEMEDNSCDGCKAGIPVDEYNYHRMGKGIYPDFMVCQKSKYNKSKVEPSSEFKQGVVKALEVIY